MCALIFSVVLPTVSVYEVVTRKPFAVFHSMNGLSSDSNWRSAMMR